ncbi:unnamed protein product [Chondrus crispus]|uniref:Uncharacterized protein n=1 Tax=Chondrus crispus TaxID=2769 RepID=R7QPF1_CHOCR|nr:unnamed protein product [Chondrus crispus]CDF39270.1 unnamed protein product [Chondrus crispus]|eukprot:XP_005719181.1 unnamed protein product [Chondrus crispus]
MPNTAPTPSEDAEDRNGGDESPTIAALLATVQREGGEVIDAAGRNVAVREGFAWILEALAKRGLGKGAVAEGEEEEKPNDAREVVEEREKGREKEEDGLGDGLEDGLNAAVAWILEAVAKRRKEGEAAKESVDESDLVHVSEEETAIQRVDSDGMSTSPLSWIAELLPGNIPASAPVNDPDLAEGAEPRSEELVPATTTDEVENQLVSWLSSHLSPTATKEEVLDQTVSWISSNLSSASANLSTIALQGMLQRGSDVASQLSTNAMLATLNALNVEPFDTVDTPDDTHLPRHPYDPVHALTLAAYSFRAYLEPPSSSYRETFAAPVDGSELSGLDRQLVYTDFVYPSTEVLAQRAKGAVMVQVVASEGLEEVYVVVEMNGVLVLDLFKKKHCAMLCQRDPPSSRFRSIGGASDDELVINVFPNEKAYVEGSPLSAISVFSLADFVRQGLESGRYVDEGECTLKFQKVLNEGKDRDFFHFSLLPKEMRLPFPFQSVGKDSEETDPKSVGSASITLRLSFIPFLNSPEGDKMKEVSSLLADAEATSFQKLTSTTEDLSISSVLKAKLSPGQLPDPGDWRRLAGAVRNLVDDDDTTLDIQRTATLTEDLPSTLFVESLATNTAVWLFHDTANKDVVISFRRTEQVSWKDFFTDAQMFLQLWVPGVKIDLNVDKDRTVGLADFIPGVLPSQETSIPIDASAIHYGFLRTYPSIRDALIRGLKMVSMALVGTSQPGVEPRMQSAQP